MPDETLELADRLWRGEVPGSEYHPVGHRGGLAEICDGVAFVPSFGNVSAFATEDGLVLVDTGISFAARAVHSELRRWNGQRLNTAVYSHGNIDHVCGLPPWDAEAADRSWPAPVVALVDRHRVFSARADAATSTMARGIFGWAAREAQGDPDGQAGD
jgi:glyoxylase-like metal-dependent hydrolase (beta-lactamase superfamily II)